MSTNPQDRKGFHCYLRRHVFHGDTCIGKLDVRAKRLEIPEEHGELAEKARAHFSRMLQFPVKLGGKGE